MRDRNSVFDRIVEEVGKEAAPAPEPGFDEAGEAAGNGGWKWKAAVGFAAHALPAGIALALIAGFVTAAGFAFSILMSFFGSSEREWGGDRPSYVNGANYRSYFSAEMGDVPFGIPVERGYVSKGFDDGLNLFGIETYRKHAGLDFSRLYGDKVSWYYPVIFATHNAVVVHAETRYEDPSNADWYVYEKKLYLFGTYVAVRSKVKKSKAEQNIDVKPYGINVMLSTPDGRYYTLYGHMTSYNEDLFAHPSVLPGDVVGVMGNTGNSFGAHLHYEIRYCGEDNADFSKTLRQCSPVNPLSEIPGRGTNFVGYDPSWWRTVYAGSVDAKRGVPVASADGKPADDASGIKSGYEAFCRDNAFLFVGKSAACKDVFPIVYQYEGEEDYPAITDGAEAAEAGKKYVDREYGAFAALDPAKSAEIAALEGIPSANYASGWSLYAAVGKTLSWGKYGNRMGMPYKRRELVASSVSAEADRKRMLSDLADSVDRLKRSAPNQEGLYAAYFRPGGYKGPSEDPRIYNFADSKRIFMYLRDAAGNPTWIFRKYGTMATYAKLD